MPFDGGTDDFDGTGNIPWFLGNPPEWRMRNGFMSNIISNELSDVKTLTLKVKLSSPSTLKCTAKLDIAMPFDRFSLSVNGQVRNTYFQQSDDLVQVVNGIAPGDVTIELQVTNGDMFPGFDRSIEPRYGTGEVQLETCSIETN